MPQKNFASGLEELRSKVLAGELSRRDVLRRALALGLSAPVIASLLAACGDDDDDDDAGAAAEPTATSAKEEEEDEPTEAPEEEEEEEPTEAEEEEEPTEAAEEEEEEPTEDEGEPAGEAGGGGKITLLYWQAVTILNPHLSQGTKDNHGSRVCGE